MIKQTITINSDKTNSAHNWIIDLKKEKFPKSPKKRGLINNIIHSCKKNIEPYIGPFQTTGNYLSNLISAGDIYLDNENYLVILNDLALKFKVNSLEEGFTGKTETTLTYQNNWKFIDTAYTDILPKIEKPRTVQINYYT